MASVNLANISSNNGLVPVRYKVITSANDVIMTTMASRITSLTVVYSTVYSDADQRKHQSSASLAFVWGIHRDRWIPRTKGQLRGKCFHLMTSSSANDDLVSTGFTGTIFRESQGKIQWFSLKKIHMQMSSANRIIFCDWNTVFLITIMGFT